MTLIYDTNGHTAAPGCCAYHDGQAKNAEIAALQTALDEARASLARVTGLLDAEHRDHLGQIARAQKAEAECARLREEGAAAEARGFDRGVEAAARYVPDNFRGDLDVYGCVRALVSGIRALRSPSPAPSPARRCNHPNWIECGDSCRAPSPKEDAPRCPLCEAVKCHGGCNCKKCHGTGRSPSTAANTAPAAPEGEEGTP